jgi:PilZ domain
MRACIEGQAVNLSERGVYFVCRENVMTGEEVEMFFTIPSELTRRAAESIRCKARIVHAEPLTGNHDMTGAGVLVETFDPLARSRDWAN